FQRLRLEAVHPEIPEHRRLRADRIRLALEAVERDVQDGLAVALDEMRRLSRNERSRRTEPGAVRAEREIETVGVAERRVMARRAGHVLLPRQDGIPEQQAAQRDAGRR